LLKDANSLALYGARGANGGIVYKGNLLYPDRNVAYPSML